MTGIAVSGGADSMALAYLCKQLERSPEISGAISLTAFVVDHLARPESTIEAQRVAGWLRDMGMASNLGPDSKYDLTKSKQTSKLRFSSWTGLNSLRIKTSHQIHPSYLHLRLMPGDSVSRPSAWLAMISN